MATQQVCTAVGRFGFGRGAAGLAVWLALVGCGAGSPADSGPAAAYCHDYNVAQCGRTFECATAAQRSDPFFMALFGSSAGDCAQRWTAQCQKPTGDTRPSVVCPAGSVVDQAKAQQCLTKVMTATCEQLDEPDSTAICEQVCGVATSTDGGTPSDAAADPTDGRPGDGGATGPSPEKAAFCQQVFPLLCKRTFECIAAADRDASFTTAYGATQADCVALRTANCANYLPGCVFHPTNAQACLQELPTVECQVVDVAGMPAILPPADCLVTCPVSLSM